MRKEKEVILVKWLKDHNYYIFQRRAGYVFYDYMHGFGVWSFRENFSIEEIASHSSNIKELI